MDKVTTALGHIRQQGLLVVPVIRVDIADCPDDPDDRIFLECAEAAGADYLVIGNRRHFPNQWKSTRIVTARKFWEVVVAGRRE